MSPNVYLIKIINCMSAPARGGSAFGGNRWPPELLVTFSYKSNPRRRRKVNKIMRSINNPRGKIKSLLNFLSLLTLYKKTARKSHGPRRKIFRKIGGYSAIGLVFHSWQYPMTR